MISSEGLAALRVGATLTHALPGLRGRIRGGGGTLVEVRAPRDDDGDLPRVMSPCAFRCAVARAHRLNQAGQAMEMTGLTHGDPAIEIGTPPGGAARPGGIYRVPVGDQYHWGFAVLLDAEVAFALGRDLVEAAQPLIDVLAIGLRRDRATDVTFTFARTRATPGSPAEEHLVDLFESLLARWTIQELLSAEPGSTHDRRAL